jgi:hypothetical protein
MRLFNVSAPFHIHFNNTFVLKLHLGIRTEHRLHITMSHYGDDDDDSLFLPNDDDSSTDNASTGSASTPNVTPKNENPSKRCKYPHH